MRTCTRILLALFTFGTTAYSSQGGVWSAADEVVVSRPVFYYLPLKSRSSERNQTADDVRLNSNQWTAAASPDVRFLDLNNEFAGRFAVFNESSLIELDGSSRFEAPGLSVALWFCSDQVWDAKYWPGSTHSLIYSPGLHGVSSPFRIHATPN